MTIYPNELADILSGIADRLDVMYEAMKTGSADAIAFADENDQHFLRLAAQYLPYANMSRARIEFEKRVAENSIRRKAIVI